MADPNSPEALEEFLKNAPPTFSWGEDELDNYAYMRGAAAAIAPDPIEQQHGEIE